MLCTCDDAESLQDPDWILQQRDTSRPEHHRRGRAAIPRYSDDEQACLDQVIAKLDEGSCFDFEYTPRAGDVLTLRWKARKKRVRFRFERGGWTVDRSTSLTGWRAQMVTTACGATR